MMKPVDSPKGTTMPRTRPIATILKRLLVRLPAIPSYGSATATLLLGAGLVLSGCNSSSFTDGLQPIGDGTRKAASAPSRPGVKTLDAPGPLRFGDHKPVDFGKRHPDLYPVHGIDVSKWQGDIDWKAVKRAGVAFAFIKSTEGGDHNDSRFNEYWRQARAVGIPHAPYHFYYFCRPAREQAAWFIANVPRAAVQMPPVLDVEWNHHSRTCTHRPSPATVRAEMKIWMDMVTRHYGKRPIIYTPVDFHRENLDGHFKGYQFWLRSVAAHPQDIYPDHPWTFWQYTGTGMMDGIKGHTDINAFAGSRKQWQDWLRKYAR